MSTLAPTRRGLRKFGSVRFARAMYRQQVDISTEIVVARYRGVSRATGKANLARAGLTARCSRQHGAATAKSRRRAGCHVRSSGRRQSCGVCECANSHPAKNGNRRGRACRMGLVAGNVIRCYWCECPGTNVRILRTRPHNIRKTA
jgi:hypothetical protein